VGRPDSVFSPEEHMDDGPDADLIAVAEANSARAKTAWTTASARFYSAKADLDLAYAEYIAAMQREVTARGGTLIVLCDPYEAASRREGK